MKFLSVCSGIEAASVAWKTWQPVAFSEIEPFPCAVLKHHYPDVPNWGDMTKFKEWPDAAIDVLVGGTPCQSFSVAGLRKGLDDPRGNLMLTYLAIAAKYRPAWLVWENVPGVLSSNGGRDFASLLRGLGELGYGWAYRVLDAQYFGVAQRRRRVFVVGHLGDWHRAAAVLFERHSLSGNPAPSRKTREGTAADAQGGVDSGIPATVGALTDGAHMGGGSTAKTPTQVAYLPSVANCLTARMFKGFNSTLSDGQTPIVTTGGVFDAIPFDTTQMTSAANYSRPKPGDPCHPLAAGAHAPAIAIQGNLIGRDDGGPQGVGASEDGVMYTLTKADVHGVAQPMAFQQNTRDEVRFISGDGQIAGALAAKSGMKQTNYIAQPAPAIGAFVDAISFHNRQDPISSSDGSTHALTSGSSQGTATVAVAVPMINMQGSKGNAVAQADGPSFTLNAMHGHDVHAVAVAFQPGNVTRGAGSEPSEQVFPTLKSDHGRGLSDQQPHVLTAMQVRRLTPRECERLQGFPDDYTLIPWRGKEAPDGPRYKALGNSMAVPVMAWIGQRIDQVAAITAEKAAA